MWVALSQRFSAFNANLKLTPDQVDDGTTKHQGVRACLNRAYYGVSSETQNSFLIGSWAKATQVRPPRDVDLYFVIPYADYMRFEGYQGNKQSALLQEVKGVLQETYPATDMRGDGQVVIVRFNTINVEVAPVIALQGGQYWVPNTNDGGSYKNADPTAEVKAMADADTAYNANARRMVRMLKAWQATCNVDIKSFHLELLVTQFLPQSPWRLNSYFYYDWLMRDFFRYLIMQANNFVFAPGTFELMWLGDAWKSRAETAYDRSLKACDFEYYDKVADAGLEWQKIFGTQIPMIP